jgi:hypothetical protein
VLVAGQTQFIACIAQDGIAGVHASGEDVNIGNREVTQQSSRIVAVGQDAGDLPCRLRHFLPSAVEEERFDQFRPLELSEPAVEEIFEGRCA